MTDAIRAIEFLLDNLAGGTKIHCDVFRHIYGMKSGTAERRLRDYRDLYHDDDRPLVYYPSGYVAHRSAHMWTFTRPFLRFLAQQVTAAKKLERQNAKV